MVRERIIGEDMTYIAYRVLLDDYEHATPQDVLVLMTFLRALLRVTYHPEHLFFAGCRPIIHLWGYLWYWLADILSSVNYRNFTQSMRAQKATLG